MVHCTQVAALRNAYSVDSLRFNFGLMGSVAVPEDEWLVPRLVGRIADLEQKLFFGDFEGSVQESKGIVDSALRIAGRGIGTGFAFMYVMS